MIALIIIGIIVIGSVFTLALAKAAGDADRKHEKLFAEYLKEKEESKQREG